MIHRLQKYARLTIFLLAAPVIACGLLAEATPTAAPTPAPTETAQPAPTSTGTPSLTFIDHEEVDSGLSFRYPESWELEVDDGSIVVASDTELLSAQQFDHEGAGVMIIFGPAESFEGDSLEDSLNSAIEAYDFTENDRVVEGPSRTSVNGQEAVTATIEGADSGGSQSLVVMVTMLRRGDRAAFIAAVTLQNSIDQYRETLQTIANSVVLQELETSGVSQPMGTLQYGQTITGEIPAGGSASWTFIGVEGERIDINARPLQEELDLTLDVHDDHGDSILPSGPIDDSLGPETIRALTLPNSAQYTIVVAGYAQANGSFELTLAEAGAQSAAQLIVVGETVNGSLELDEHDDYSFRSQDREAITIVVNPEEELDVVFEVISEDGGVLFQEDSSYGQEQLSFTPDSGADYILRVRGFAGASGDYSIIVQAGGVGSTGTTLTASDSLDAGNSDGHDFPFTVDPGEVVQAVVQPDGDFDVVVEIWNDDTEEMEDSIDASFGREEVNFTAAQGSNYYFKVLGFEGQGGSYTITLSGPPGVIFELAFGDQVEGDMGEVSSIDYYLRLDAGDNMALDVQPDAETDILVQLLDLDENVISEVDEGFSGEAEQLTFTAPDSPADGAVYLIRVSDFSGESGGTFSMSLE